VFTELLGRTLQSVVLKNATDIVKSVEVLMNVTVRTAPTDALRLGSASVIFSQCDIARTHLSNAAVLSSGMRQSLSFLQDALDDLASNEADIEEDEEEGASTLKDACHPLMIVCLCIAFTPGSHRAQALCDTAKKAFKHFESLSLDNAASVRASRARDHD
jgi:hypothetical protein